MWGAFGNVPHRCAAHRAPPARSARRGRRRRPLDTDGAGLAAVRRPGARRQGLERRPGLRGRSPNRRVQVFTPDGKYVTQVFINRAGPSARSAAGLALLARHAAAVPLRRRLRQLAHRSCSIARRCEVLYQFGQRSAKPGRLPGRCITSRSIRRATSTPPKCCRATRAQRSSYKGLSTTLPPNADVAQLSPAPAHERGARTLPAPRSGARRLSRHGPARWPTRTG